MAHIRVFKHYVHVPYLLLGVLEGVILIAAVFIGAVIRFQGDPAFTVFDVMLWFRAFLFAVLMLVGMVAMGVYQAYPREGLSGLMLRTAISYFCGSAVLSTIFYLFPSLILGRGVFIIAAIGSFLMICVIRIILVRFSPANFLKRRVLVFGAGNRAKIIEDKVNDERSARGFVLTGFVPVGNEPILVEPSLCIYSNGESRVFDPATSKRGDILKLLKTHQVDEIVVAVDDRRQNFPHKELLAAKMQGVVVLDVNNFFERETNKLEIDLLNPSWLVFSDGFFYSPVRAVLSRAFDLFASSFLLLITWPLMLGAMIAIWIEDGFSVDLFYRQKRVGLNGELFYVLKFRSMRQDAEKMGVQWAVKDDPRVTKVGKYLRKYRIDELPQILNVFNGDMGFVGPRPERPEFVEKLKDTIPFYDERHRVKPGITGWAQLCYPYGSDEEDAKMKLKYDLYYVKNNSLLLDVLILVQTAEIIMFGKGI